MVDVLVEEKSARASGNHKYVQFRKLLERHIEDGQVGDPLPSYVQMLSELKVSRWIADRALQDLCAEGRVVRVNGKGIYIAKRAKQKTVAIIYGADAFTVLGSNAFALLLLDDYSLSLQQRDHRLLTFFGSPTSDAEAEREPKYSELMRALRAKEIDGIICGGGGPMSLEWLASHGIPVVSAAPRPASVSLDRYAWVRFDRTELIRQGVNVLKSQGCNEVGFITSLGAGYEPNDDNFEDALTFRSMLEAQGITYNRDWVWSPRSDGRIVARQAALWHEQQGYQALMDLWRTTNTSGKRPAGIVVTDEYMTRGCLFAALKLGLKIGRDIKIASHVSKNLETLTRFEDDLALMEFNPHEIAERMITILSAMMLGEPHETDRILLPTLKLPINAAL